MSHSCHRCCVIEFVISYDNSRSNQENIVWYNQVKIDIDNRCKQMKKIELNRVLSRIKCNLKNKLTYIICSFLF